MKHLKSSSSDLRRLFERAITIREIAEPLVSFDTDHDAEAIRVFMEERNFDVVGLRQGGTVVGYVRRDDLTHGSVTGCLTRFQAGEVLAEREPLSAAIQALRDQNQLFITVRGQVRRIATKGDMQKVPVRLWLFGLISLIEMQMLRLIRQRFPGGAWTSLLSPARVEAARKVSALRQKQNREADASDFLDCLQICDKATIMLKDSELSALARFPSREVGGHFFSHLESLRNDLAHSNDILQGRWPGLAELAAQCESLLTRLEAGQVRLPEFAGSASRRG
jgi:hypothetical protein